jgi:predicted ABC-type ATPase
VIAGGPPLVVVLAGPNGAGKSTSAPYLLRGTLSVEEFVNADTIAQGLSAYRPESAALAAGRVMLARLRLLGRQRADFAFETTLAGRGHALLLGQLRSTGYRVHLAFLSLPSADLAVARVADRVKRGGHDVPEVVVRRRFAAGLVNLFSLYLGVVDSWDVYDNSDLAAPRRLASGVRDGGVTVEDAAAWRNIHPQGR